MEDVDLPLLQREFRQRRIGCEIVYEPVCSSTNDVALKLAEERYPEGTVVFTDQQTEGRGRKGHEWFSPPRQGIYCSVLLYPPPKLYKGLPITLWTSLAVLDAIRDITELELSIKWPNDLYHGGRKVGGTMAVVRKIADVPVPVAVLGIGFNVNVPEGDFPPELAQKATSLRAILGRTVSRQRLVIALLLRLDQKYRMAKEGERARLLGQLRKRGNFFDRRVRVRRENDPFTGRVHSLEPNGTLVILRDGTGEEVPLLSGQIELLEETDG